VAPKVLKRYQIKKSVMAESLIDAILIEKQVNAEHAWLDDNQPEPQEKPSLIGFRIPDDEEWHSEIM
jgi:hypothetical protein